MFKGCVPENDVNAKRIDVICVVCATPMQVLIKFRKMVKSMSPDVGTFFDVAQHLGLCKWAPFVPQVAQKMSLMK